MRREYTLTKQSPKRCNVYLMLFMGLGGIPPYLVTSDCLLTSILFYLCQCLCSGFKSYLFLVLEQKSVGHLVVCTVATPQEVLPWALGSPRAMLNGLVFLNIFYCSGRSEGSWSTGEERGGGK